MSMMRFNHMELTLPKGTMTDEFRADLESFYGGVFGWGIKPTKVIDLDAERLAAAETNYRKGEILMRQGNFRGALEFLRPAVELWPEDGTYQGALGWALFKAAPSDPVRAREHLERALALEPRNTEIAHHLSLVLKVLGEVAPAANLESRVRELDPNRR